MIVELSFTPKEIEDFFTGIGLLIEPRQFGNFQNRSHGSEEWVEYEAAAVVIGDEYVHAEELFKKVAQYRLKSLIAPIDDQLKNVVNILFETLSKDKLKIHKNGINN